MNDRTDVSLVEHADEGEKDTTRQRRGAETAPRAGDEFQLTIRKLEMPVRPRGVLAE